MRRRASSSSSSSSWSSSLSSSSSSSSWSNHIKSGDNGRDQDGDQHRHEHHDHRPHRAHYRSQCTHHRQQRSCVPPRDERNTSAYRLCGAPALVRAGRFGVYGAGALGNQPNGPPRPLAQKGIRGYALCCAGIGAANANVNGFPCCPLRTPRSSTYQGRLPISRQLAGRTFACPRAFPVN